MIKIEFPEELVLGFYVLIFVLAVGCLLGQGCNYLHIEAMQKTQLEAKK